MLYVTLFLSEGTGCGYDLHSESVICGWVNNPKSQFLRKVWKAQDPKLVIHNRQIKVQENSSSLRRNYKTWLSLKVQPETSVLNLLKQIQNQNILWVKEIMTLEKRWQQEAGRETSVQSSAGGGLRGSQRSVCTI